MMKKLLYITLLIALPLQAQDPIMAEIGPKTNLWNGAEADYKAIAEKLGSIEEKMAVSGIESLTTEEKQFLMDNEMAQSPFSTEEMGCSWYCAAAIKGLSASSHLPSSKSANYAIENVHDFDLKTAWATNTNKGIDQTITIDFIPSDVLSLWEIHFYNGYQKSETTFKNNSRVKKAALSINGEYFSELEFEDTEAVQIFHLGKEYLYGETKFTVELKILEIYPGDKYDDLCISEINFDGEGDH